MAIVTSTYMDIATGLAFSMLDFYRRHGTHLQFTGQILGEEASCGIAVTEVENALGTISIRLFSDERDQSWDRVIAMKRATFSLFQAGEPSFQEFADPSWHSVLYADFPDGTRMLFAELIG